MKRCLFVIIIFTFAICVYPIAIEAEQFVGSNVDKRISIGLHVKQSEAQKWLPEPWQVDPIAKGPFKDSNLFIIFLDRLLNQDPEGKPSAGGTFRAAAFAVPAKHSQTGESAPFVIRIYAPHEDINLFNSYKNTFRAAISREHTLKCSNLEPGIGSEYWEVLPNDGGNMQLRVTYQRSVPRRANLEAKPRSAVEPEFFRIYRIDQGTDLIRSVPAGLDRVQSFKLKVAIPEFRKMFDGSEQVVGVVLIPWYVRKTFLP